MVDIFLFELSKGLSVFIARHHWRVRRPIPDRREERLARLALRFHVREGLIYNDHRRVPFEFLEVAIAAHHRVQIEEIGNGQPFVIAVFARVILVVAQDGHAWSAQTVQVPLAEVARGVTRCAQGFRNRLLLQSQNVAVLIHARAVIGPSRQHAGSRRRANGRPRIEPVEAQTVGRHSIEIGRF